MGDFELKLGANYRGAGLTHFRVWAPERHTVEVCLEGPGGLRRLALEKSAGGYFAGTHPALPGQRYRYCLDRGPCLPDPCSRWQPEGPHGPSEILDPRGFAWTDAGWEGLTREGLVLYELHVGTFSAEGTYAGVEARLPYLRELGVNTLELMPLNTFPGRFNWGYDGVGLFAPCARYGTPDELRRLVDAAHRLGMGVILDAVYNHLGPDGNYLPQYSRDYFTDRYPHTWGQPVNFEGSEALPSRDFFLQNAAYWISEFHLDGLRLDAVHHLFDGSQRHILAELTAAARAAAHPRRVVVTAESDPPESLFLAPPEEGGHGLDALWVDDFQYSVTVAATGRAQAHLGEFRGTSQELLSCALRNSLYQGQWFSAQGRRRGSVLFHLPPDRMVFFLQNHDQVASNTLGGERLQLAAGLPRMRALTAFWLLLPQTPLLFMGQEFFASTPFLYFVDHHEELQGHVARGRASHFDHFPSAVRALQAEGYRLDCGEEAFQRSKLDWSERARNEGALLLHRELLRLRREDETVGARRLLGAVLSPTALVLRYLGDEPGGDRLLLLNLGADLRYEPCPEPLLAPPYGMRWELILSSEESRFGGAGGSFPTGEGPWLIPGQCTVLLRPEPLAE